MHNRHRSPILLFSLVLAIAATAQAAAPEMLVKITGTKQGVFKGESVQKGREDQLLGLSFGYDLTSPTDLATGQATGRLQYGIVTFAKAWGAASPQIFQAISTNEILKTVVFQFLESDLKGGTIVFYRVTLTNARISKFRQGISMGGTVAVDSVSLAYQTIEVESVTGNTSAIGEPGIQAARSVGSAFGLSYSMNNGNFKVDLPDEEVELRFLDLNGALVKSLSARGGEVRFDARSLGVQPGMYLLKASVAGQPLGTVPVSIAK